MDDDDRHRLSPWVMAVLSEAAGLSQDTPLPLLADWYEEQGSYGVALVLRKMVQRKC